jgi:hypothetical protein
MYINVLVIALSRNAGKDCVHKTQSGQTLPRTLRKQELRPPGYPFFIALSNEHDILGRGQDHLGSIYMLFYSVNQLLLIYTNTGMYPYILIICFHIFTSWQN